MDDRKLRRQCETILNTLEISEPFDIQQLCARLGDRRGRRIYLTALDITADMPCGMFVSTSRFDAIFYRADTSRPHQEHIIGHEIGHLLCQHTTAPVTDSEAIRLLLPDLDPALVQRMLSRSGYDATEEREAEIIASLISRKASRAAATHQPNPPRAADEVVNRIARSLESRGATRER
jgi:hypothetical protein